ncbi:DUF2007 domain-containing protein [Halomonas sp. 18H]|uniref:putative signal transducing protein n=1 Tax=Halomonas almeriensis TaxID=308163 RepID=UPI002231E63C|nr:MULTISPECIES: DUF2007 domain-containing protein [Halomonas]MCW4152480.1 DUF2007 domain-containing protein [Halomonas sp. 18H]MDN3553944.1 DUF2007 domain-containing protein [Halomonas almeriensis]
MTAFGVVRVFAHSNPLLVGHVANLLEADGIPVERRNMTLGGAAGELPPMECEPEVWVAAQHQAWAESLIEQMRRRTSRPGWVCPVCAEALDGVFDCCWNCGTDRP